MRECATELGPEITERELNSLLDALEVAQLSDTHLEIGTAAGGTLCRLIQFYKEKGAGPAFMVVDPMQYFNNQFAIIRKNMTNHHNYQ